MLCIFNSIKYKKVVGLKLNTKMKYLCEDMENNMSLP